MPQRHTYGSTTSRTTENLLQQLIAATATKLPMLSKSAVAHTTVLSGSLDLIDAENPDRLYVELQNISSSYPVYFNFGTDDLANDYLLLLPGATWNSSLICPTGDIYVIGTNSEYLSYLIVNK